MTPQAALIELLERVSASQGKAVLVNDEDLAQWPTAAVIAMKTQVLISKANPASSAICPGCERDCDMPVHIIPAKENLPSRAFISCDKRSDIRYIQQALSQNKKPIGFFIGARCLLSVRVNH